MHREVVKVGLVGLLYPKLERKCLLVLYLRAAEGDEDRKHGAKEEAGEGYDQDVVRGIEAARSVAPAERQEEGRRRSV